MKVERSYGRLNRRVETYHLPSLVSNQSDRQSTSCIPSDFAAAERAVFSNVNKLTRHKKIDVYVSVSSEFNFENFDTSWQIRWLKSGRDQKNLAISKPIDPAQAQRETIYREISAGRVCWFDERSDHPPQAPKNKKLASGFRGNDRQVSPQEVDFSSDERDLVFGSFTNLDGSVTLLPAACRSEAILEAWLHRRQNWGIKQIELRDDLLTNEQMECASALLPIDNTLVSFRDPNRTEQTKKLVLQNASLFDWPVEMGQCTFAQPKYLSLQTLHVSNNIKETLNRFPRAVHEGTVLRAELEVNDFWELFIGHEWMAAFPEARVFLPVSGDGRWSWYRQWLGSRGLLNFFCEDEGAGPDQPTLLQWAQRRRIEKSGRLVESLSRRRPRECLFAAILSEPGSSSSVDLELKSFFSRYGASLFSISVSEEEVRNGALSFLCRLGLRWAAVAQSLHKTAYELSASNDSTAQRTGVVDTMYWHEDSHRWVGAHVGQCQPTSGLATLLEHFGDAAQRQFWAHHWENHSENHREHHRENHSEDCCETEFAADWQAHRAKQRKG